MAAADENELIAVASDRLQQLEELEKNLPDLIKQAIADYKKENLRKLHEKDKNNPEAVKNRVRKYISKNKDKINERRREKRREKALMETQERAAAIAASASASSASASAVLTSVCQGDPYEPTTGLTVRFND